MHQVRTCGSISAADVSKCRCIVSSHLPQRMAVQYTSSAHLRQHLHHRRLQSQVHQVLSHLCKWQVFVGRLFWGVPGNQCIS